MMRPLRFPDVPRLVEMIADQHKRSRYADLELDDAGTRRLLAQLVQRNGGRTDGSTICFAEEVDGRIEAFIIGLLQPVYMIFKPLCAKDVFLVASDKAPQLTSRKLIGAYIQWATANPAVHEIELTQSDVLPEAERIGRVYEKMGFERFGTSYRRTLERGEAREAA